MNRKAHERIWLSPAEVADLFGVCTRTVSRWLDMGQLPGYRLPGGHRSRRVLRVKLIEFIRQRPEFQFALELLNGQPISSRSARDPAEGREDASSGEDRGEGVDRPTGLDEPDPDAACD